MVTYLARHTTAGDDRQARLAQLIEAHAAALDPADVEWLHNRWPGTDQDGTGAPDAKGLQAEFLAHPLFQPLYEIET